MFVNMVITNIFNIKVLIKKNHKDNNILIYKYRLNLFDTNNREVFPDALVQKLENKLFKEFIYNSKNKNLQFICKVRT